MPKGLLERCNARVLTTKVTPHCPRSASRAMWQHVHDKERPRGKRNETKRNETKERVLQDSWQILTSYYILPWRVCALGASMRTKMVSSPRPQRLARWLGYALATVVKEIGRCLGNVHGEEREECEPHPKPLCNHGLFPVNTGLQPTAQLRRCNSTAMVPIQQRARTIVQQWYRYSKGPAQYRWRLADKRGAK